MSQFEKKPRGLWQSTKLVTSSAADSVVSGLGAVATVADAAEIFSRNLVIGAEFSNEMMIIETEALRQSRLAELKAEHPDLAIWDRYQTKPDVPTEEVA